jgi:hypothetical protein
MERERERSTSSHFASHTGAQSRLAFPARDQLKATSLTNLHASRRRAHYPARLLPTSRESLDPLHASTSQGQKSSRLHGSEDRKFAAPWRGGAGQHSREREREKVGGGEDMHGGAYEARARRAEGCRRVLHCVRAVLWPAPLAPLRTRTS